MSSTRRSTTGIFSQERFCSAPEFEGDTVNGLAAAKRIALVNDRSVREVLWFIQWRSLAPRGLQQLCGEVVAAFPERIGSPRIRKLGAIKREFVKQKEIYDVREECGFDDKEVDFSSWTFRMRHVPLDQWKVEFYRQRARDELPELPQRLKEFCLNPKADILNGVWFFADLFGALITVRDRFIQSARLRLADTIVTKQINETLNFWFAERRMVSIEGVAGIGRTASARAWADAHAGMVRFIEVPSSSDDRSFFASIARELGVARGTSMKAQEIKVRVEEMLATSELMLAFDEAQYLWGQYLRPSKAPDRLLWIKSMFDAGTPIALIAHTDFSKWQAHYVKQTLWTDEQFERRRNRKVSLPTEHSREDMLKIARAHHPGGDLRSWKLLAAYALGTEKKQASGIVEALASAHYRAARSGHGQVTFADIETALIQDHGFLNRNPTPDIQAVNMSIAKPLQQRIAGRPTLKRLLPGRIPFESIKTALPPPAV
jgi:hypothetical protein